MKLNNTDKNALQVIINHTLRDIGYGVGGSYCQLNSQGKIHKTDVKLAQRGVFVLIKLIQEK